MNVQNKKTINSSDILATKERKNTNFPGLLFFLPMLAKVFLEQDLEGLDQEHQHVFFV